MQICHFAFLLFFYGFHACYQVPEHFQPRPAQHVSPSSCAQQQGREKAPSTATNILFQSTDGGQTWQDISAGLPADLKAQGFFVGDAEVYLRAENEIYRSSTASTTPVWEKELLLNDPKSSLSHSKAGLIAYNSAGHFFQKINALGVWVPIYTSFQNKQVRTIFEAQNGTVFIGCDNGIFKSADQGKTWKHVYENGWMIKMTESGGVLLCTNEHGILRSVDGGDHWDLVVSEGGVGIDVAIIEGGFAAITYNTESETRRVRTSADGGKTWQCIDAGLPPQASISSIKQLGKYLFCGHPAGIFRSADKGKTWELILPAIGEKVFNLSVSGNVMYALPQNGGC